MGQSLNAAERGRMDAATAKRTLNIDPGTGADVRAARFVQHLSRECVFQRAACAQPQARRRDGVNAVTVPLHLEPATAEREYIRLAAIACFCPGPSAAEHTSPVERFRVLWTHRQAYGAAFVREFLQ